MTITGLTTSVTTTHEVAHQGAFEGELPAPISYGQAGMLSPSSWSLTVVTRTTIRDGVTKEFTSYRLNLYGKSNHYPFNQFKADFGFPSAGRISEYDYGYGFGGFLQEAPRDILAYLSEVTKTDLLSV